MNNYVALTLGMLCAGAGGELFLRGALGVAGCLRISPAATRATVAVFATAGAEILVVVQAARIGRPDLAIGAALGTSIVNLGLVLAVAWLTGDNKQRNDATRRQVALAAVAPLGLWTFARNGMVSRNEGTVLCALFAAWMLIHLVATRGPASGPVEDEVVAERRGWLAISFSFVGLLLLTTAGRLIVYGIEGMALRFQMDCFILGATLAPLCTTVPELTHAIVTQYRGGERVSTSAILENGLLNAWLLAGLAALIAPTRLSFDLLTICATVVMALTLLVWPGAAFPLRLRGLVLLSAYAGFVAYLL